MEVINYYRVSDVVAEMKRVLSKHSVVYVSFTTSTHRETGDLDFCTTSLSFYKSNRRHTWTSREPMPKVPLKPKEEGEPFEKWKEEASKQREEIQKLQVFLSVRFQSLEKEILASGLKIVQARIGGDLDGVFDSQDLLMKTRESLKEMAEQGKKQMAQMKKNQEKDTGNEDKPMPDTEEKRPEPTPSSPPKKKAGALGGR